MGLVRPAADNVAEIATARMSASAAEAG